MGRVARGFTLVELLVSIGIVAILAGIAVPAAQEYRYRAMHTERILLTDHMLTKIGTKAFLDQREVEDLWYSKMLMGIQPPAQWPSKKPIPWAYGPGSFDEDYLFDFFGIENPGPTRCAYVIANAWWTSTGATGETIEFHAICNVDGDHNAHHLSFFIDHGATKSNGSWVAGDWAEDAYGPYPGWYVFFGRDWGHCSWTGDTNCW